MANVSIGLRFLAADGTTVVLDVSQANGYQVVSLGTVERQHRRSVAEADDVEGDQEVQAVLAGAVLAVQVRVLGSSQSQVETRRLSLVAAAEQRSWKCETSIGGVVDTWLARKADSSTGREQVSVLNVQREVGLRIPVQPRTVEETD